MNIENVGFSSLHCLLFQLLNRKSLFSALHSDINSKVWPPSFNCPALLQEGRSAKVQDGI